MVTFCNGRAVQLPGSIRNFHKEREEGNKTVDTEKRQKAETTIQDFLWEFGLTLEKEQYRISLEKKQLYKYKYIYIFVYLYIYTVYRMFFGC